MDGQSKSPAQGYVKKGGGYKAEKLTTSEHRTVQRRNSNTLSRGTKELPAIPPKPGGQRGSMAKSDAHNLWERLNGDEEAILLFAKTPQVAFTNNRQSAIYVWRR